MKTADIHTLDELNAHIDHCGGLKNCVIQDVDLCKVQNRLLSLDVDNAVFLGCQFSKSVEFALSVKGAVVFPEIPGLPYQPYRSGLYSPSELFEHYDPREPCSYGRTLDAKIYQHWKAQGKADNVGAREALSQRLHDFSISNALDDFLKGFDPNRCLAIMGGHNMARNSREYKEIVYLSRALSQQGYLMLSGGGPGAMEATHVGASLAVRDDKDVQITLDILSQAPTYKDEFWLSKAFEAIATLELDLNASQSLGIPTWLYGHEPPNPFASHIAKFFSNSIREDGLITFAYGGIVFAPGSAGTLQEVFQDFAQNHYATTGKISPMVFMDTEFWTKTRPLYPFLKIFAQNKAYNDLIMLSDDRAEIIDFIKNNPPRNIEQDSFDFADVHCDKN